MAVDRREYSGGAVSTTTTGALNASGDLSVGITANTGWPFGSNKFFVVVEPGTANEEKMLVSRASSGDLTLTIASDSDRGLDDTNAVAHAASSTIYPVFTAVDADEANELASMWESKGDLVSHGAATYARLAVGTNDYVLQADSSTATGLAWGLVDTANIAADAVTAAKIAAGAVDSAELASGAVTVDKLDAATLQRTVPAGTVVATIRSSADSGWLLLDGSTVTNADSSYPALWAVVPTAWKSGTSLVLPNMADRVLAGSGATTLGATGGANTATLVENNLPLHKHSLNNHVHSLNNHTHGVTHNHGSETFTVTGTVEANNLDIVYRLPSYTSTYISGLDADNDGAIDGTTNGSGLALDWDSSHTHGWSGSVAVDLASNTVTSDGPSTTNTGQSSGDTGNTGANVAFSIRNSHLAVRFQIKAH